MTLQAVTDTKIVGRFAHDRHLRKHYGEPVYTNEFTSAPSAVNSLVTHGQVAIPLAVGGTRSVMTALQVELDLAAAGTGSWVRYEGLNLDFRQKAFALWAHVGEGNPNGVSRINIRIDTGGSDQHEFVLYESGENPGESIDATPGWKFLRWVPSCEDAKIGAVATPHEFLEGVTRLWVKFTRNKNGGSNPLVTLAMSKLYDASGQGALRLAHDNDDGIESVSHSTVGAVAAAAARGIKMGLGVISPTTIDGRLSTDEVLAILEDGMQIRNHMTATKIAWGTTGSGYAGPGLNRVDENISAFRDCAIHLGSIGAGAAKLDIVIPNGKAETTDEDDRRFIDESGCIRCRGAGSWINGTGGLKQALNTWPPIDPFTLNCLTSFAGSSPDTPEDFIAVLVGDETGTEIEDLGPVGLYDPALGGGGLGRNFKVYDNGVLGRGTGGLPRSSASVPGYLGAYDHTPNHTPADRARLFDYYAALVNNGALPWIEFVTSEDMDFDDPDFDLSVNGPAGAVRLPAVAELRFTDTGGFVAASERRAVLDWQIRSDGGGVGQLRAADGSTAIDIPISFPLRLRGVDLSQIEISADASCVVFALGVPR